MDVVYTKDFHTNDQVQNQDDFDGKFVWPRRAQVHCKSDPFSCLVLGKQVGVNRMWQWMCY